MGFVPIKLNGKELYIHSAVSNPDFGGDSVLSADPWDYVALWLRRSKNKEASFYWEQARQFYRASTELTEIASPLTSYYCFLNATKALLTYKERSFSLKHGVTGKTKSEKKSLTNEIVKFKTSGVLPALCLFLGETVTQNETYCLKDMLYHLPFLHRAFTLTYSSETELFLPIQKARFVKKQGSKEAWFMAEIEERYFSSSLTRILPSGYERDIGVVDRYVIRRKRRFDWDAKNNSNISLEKIKNYNKKIRENIVPIFSSVNSWYIKKNLKLKTQVNKSQLPLIFAAMHKLSELSRYDPITLARHFDAQHNWLITEFLKIAPAQFINHIACEITGKEFINPYAARLP